MSISYYLEPLTKGAELVTKLLHEEFGLDEKDAQNRYDSYVKPYFDKLKDTTFLFAETNYIDKVYRNSYYHYYSSKLSKYKRECVRISIFEDSILEEDFFLTEKHEEIRKKYRGFIILRPTDPFIIGRTVLSPMVLKSSKFWCCTTKFDTTANNLKLTVEGFPHSSQDTETLSCAETTLWAIMEYFSHKYSEYKPVLPGKIIHVLNKVSSERQIPSKGLNIAQMSFALRKFGFGTRIYSREQYQDEFIKLFSCYIESGLPLIVAIINRTRSIGHALISIGHQDIETGHIDAIGEMTFSRDDLKTAVFTKNLHVHDFDSIFKEYIFIDDNQPVYQKANLNSPAIHYSNPDWHTCEVQHFIVPLYPKIYLEAFEAKNFVLRFLITGPEPLEDNSHVLLKVFLASSRSFKDEVLKNSSIQDDVKGLILEASMPKFIWITEISTKELLKQRLANGLVIVDATEANILSNKPLILAAYQGHFVEFNETTGKLESSSLPLRDFTIYEHNLNSFNI